MTSSNSSTRPGTFAVPLLAGCALLVGSAACGGGGNSPTGPETAQIANVPSGSNGSSSGEGSSGGNGSSGGGSTTEGGSAPTAESGQLEIAMRDAPIDEISELWVYITGLKVKPDGEPVLRVPANSGLYNLLALQDGVTADLVEAEVPAGAYQFIEVLLDEDESYVVDAATGERLPLQIPSEKAKVNGGTFEVHGDGATFVLFDFDAERSLKRKGNGDWMLKPSLRIVQVTEDGG